MEDSSKFQGEQSIGMIVEYKKNVRNVTFRV